MTEATKKVTVEVPHRISGFFEIVDQINGVKITDPEKIGSRGAGFNLSALGRTEVIIKEVDNISEMDCSISINNELLNQQAETTNYIFEYIKKNYNKNIEIEINHTFDLPVGCGYGASGSGALGTIYGLNYLLKLNLSNREIGRIAHIAEVVNRTGLGTVCGQLAGGLSMLKEPGYPCVFERIDYNEDLLVICGSFGMIHTKSILTSPTLGPRIKQAGQIALKKLIKNPNIRTFMNASIEFVKETSILEVLELNKTMELMNDLNKTNILGASMNQLGRSVYAICKPGQEKDVFDVFKSYLPENKIFELKINKSNPKILKN